MQTACWPPCPNWQQAHDRLALLLQYILLKQCRLFCRREHACLRGSAAEKPCADAPCGDEQMVLVDGRKYGLRAGELPGVPSDADLADDVILTARLDGEPLLTASRDGHAQNGRVIVPLKVPSLGRWTGLSTGSSASFTSPWIAMLADRCATGDVACTTVTANLMLRQHLSAHRLFFVSMLQWGDMVSSPPSWGMSGE